MTAREVPDSVKRRVRAAAGDRCGYCLTPQRFAMQVLEIEHIIPRAGAGTDDEENLWLACRLCNNAKGARTHGHDPVTGKRVRLLDPRKQKWRRHFLWSDDGTRDRTHGLRAGDCGGAESE